MGLLGFLSPNSTLQHVARSTHLGGLERNSYFSCPCLRIWKNFNLPRVLGSQHACGSCPLLCPQLISSQIPGNRLCHNRAQEPITSDNLCVLETSYVSDLPSHTPQPRGTCAALSGPGCVLAAKPLMSGLGASGWDVHDMPGMTHCSCCDSPFLVLALQEICLQELLRGGSGECFLARHFLFYLLH